MPYKDESGKTVRHKAAPGGPKSQSFCARTTKVNAPGGGSRKVDCSGKDKGSKNCERRAAWGCQGKKSVKKK